LIWKDFFKISIFQFGPIDFKYKFFFEKHNALMAFLSVLNFAKKKISLPQKKELKLLGQKQNGRLPLRPVFKDRKETKKFF
jgi:hypothetical protein